MKRNFVKIISGTVLAFVVISAMTFGLMSAKAESSIKSGSIGGGLEGTWDVQVTIRNCQNNAPIRSFPSLTTFMSGGTLLDSTSGIPQALKTPGHGVWTDFGGNLWQFNFKSFNFDANGNSTGWTIIKQDAYMVNTTGNQYESTGTSEVYAPNGNLLIRGCSTTTATRFR